MKRSIALWQFCGFAFTSLAGTLLHFLYDWTNQSLITAPFSGINESTWEHMKLLYFPLFIFALIQYPFFKNKFFWCVKLAGTVSGLITIPILFYSYNGIFGKSPDWINIAIFFISAAITYLLETRLFKRGNIRCMASNLALFILVFIGMTFIIFTYNAPRLPIFQDPLTGEFGLIK